MLSGTQLQVINAAVNFLACVILRLQKINSTPPPTPTPPPFQFAPTHLNVLSFLLYVL